MLPRYARTRAKPLCQALAFCALLLGAAAVAQAQPWQTEGKTGPVMLNLKIGPAIGASGLISQFALELDAGFAVDHKRNAYILVPIQFGFSPGFTIIHIPVGFQYDFALPVKGLYLYPRGIIGYAAFVGNSSVFGGGGTVAHAGVIAPEFGIKYVLKSRWNFGFEPFSLPIYFNGNGASVAYRLLIYAGVNLP